MAPLEVTIDREACRGAHQCVRRAPRSFALDSDGVARVVDLPADAEERVVEAARCCPNFAIQVRRDGEALV